VETVDNTEKQPPSHSVLLWITLSWRLAFLCCFAIILRQRDWYFSAKAIATENDRNTQSALCTDAQHFDKLTRFLNGRFSPHCQALLFSAGEKYRVRAHPACAAPQKIEQGKKGLCRRVFLTVSPALWKTMKATANAIIAPERRDIIAARSAVSPLNVGFYLCWKVWKTGSLTPELWKVEKWDCITTAIRSRALT
jgi:hypothetical protein